MFGVSASRLPSHGEFQDNILNDIEADEILPIVCYREIEILLMKSDDQLAGMGLRRSDLQAYRDGRIKFLRRPIMAPRS